MRFNFIKSSNFWSVFIAASALVFSLNPSQWLKNESLSMLYSSRTLIFDYIGTTSYGLLVDFKNTGNTELNITKIELIIEPENDNKVIYLSDTISEYNGGSQAIITPLTRIVLKPNDHWNKTITFIPPDNQEAQSKINQLKFEFLKDLTEQQRTSNNQSLKSAKKSLITKAYNLFEQNFNLKKGTHHVELIAYSNERVLSKQFFQFQIDNYQIKAIESQKNDYRYGQGIYYPINNNKLASTKNNKLRKGT